MKVLITGNMGYVGSVLNCILKEYYDDIYLVGLDTAYYAHSIAGTKFVPELNLNLQNFMDVRDIKPDTLSGFDAIVHLAGISNDPIGNEFSNVTENINRKASLNLVKAAITQGVKNFVFASSCSMYGYSEGKPKNEKDSTNPLTAYAASKIGTENDVLKLDLGNMVFTSLRFATACGWSPRLRLDLVLNDFVASAISNRKIDVLSDGSPLRPLIDVEDMSRAIAWAIKRKVEEGGQFLAVNTGNNNSNYKVKDIAEAVSDLIPETKISINTKALPDKRSYAVDFSLFEKLASKFKPLISLEESIIKLRNNLNEIKFDDKNFRNSSLIRLNTIREHINNGHLNKNLRWEPSKNFT